MNELHLVSPVCLSVNHYLGIRAVMRGKKPVAMSYKTAEAVKYQKEFTQYVKDEVVRQGWDLIPNKTQHFYCDGYFYFDRTDRDPNNYWKLLLDAITDSGVIWLDDNVVCERAQRILYDSANPRIELVIRPVDYVGIFDDISHLEDFKSRCIGCKQYTRNCSLLRKAIEGRIQPEIADGICEKYKFKEEIKNV